MTAETHLRPAMVVPDLDRVGGYERQAFFLARATLRAGIDTFLLANNPWNHAARERRDGLLIHRLPCFPDDRRSWVNAFRAFLSFLYSHRHEYDVIHVHAFTFLAAICSLIGKLLDKPVLVKVATEQDIREFHHGRQLGFRILYPLLRRADRFLSLSEAIRDEFLHCGFPEDKLVLLPNGVDTDHFHPRLREKRASFRAELGLAADRFHFLFTGRTVRRKGLDVLLDAIACSPALRKASTVILGSGEERPALERQARASGLDDAVRFADERPEIRPFLGASDAFVFPSRLEGLPNSLLEAMSTGLPTIATRIGGCMDVVQGASGLLVEPDDPRKLATAMEDLLTNDDLRKRLSVSARQRILDHFGFDRVVRDLQGVYRSAWEARRGPVPRSLAGLDARTARPARSAIRRMESG